MEDDGGHKKRRAEKQWRREEVEAGLDERDEPVIEGNGIQVASADELSRRRFVKVGRRRGAAEAEQAPTPAPVVINFGLAETPKAKKEEEQKPVEEKADKEEKGKEAEEKEETPVAKKTEDKQEEEKTTKKQDKETESTTVSSFTFTLAQDATATAPSTGGFVFGATTSTSATPATSAPVTGFFFGAPSADAPKAEASKDADEKKSDVVTWTCQCCTEVNPESNATCKVCMVPRPAPPKVVEEGWTCACCTQLNAPASTSCSVCLVPKPL